METVKFENLRIYQEALILLNFVYIFTIKFPKDELFGITSQIRRAALSVVLNIAESQGRGTNLDQRNFLLIARGSLYEIIATNEVAKLQCYIDQKTYMHVRELVFPLLKQVNSLIRYLTTSSKR